MISCNMKLYQAIKIHVLCAHNKHSSTWKGYWKRWEIALQIIRSYAKWPFQIKIYKSLRFYDNLINYFRILQNMEWTRTNRIISWNIPIVRIWHKEQMKHDFSSNRLARDRTLYLHYCNLHPYMSWPTNYWWLSKTYFALISLNYILLVTTHDDDIINDNQ